jgi:hypothetical protein
VFAFLVSPGPLISRLAESAPPWEKEKEKGKQIRGKRQEKIQPLLGESENQEKGAMTRTDCEASCTRLSR